ncbi:MAG: methyltransferase domain-containing protein [Chloroflexi bacterium]|nr:methyltransferase domain-containing protein [Chloroflexota bacterium]
MSFGAGGELTLSSVRAHWNRVASGYDEHNLDMGVTHFQRFAEALRHLELRPGLRVVDVFARTANASRFVLEACAELHYVGVELAERMLRVARRKYPDRELVHASPHELPFVAASFDRVLSLETLEHVPEPARFLGELRRVLRSDGRLVLSTPPATAEPLVRIADTLQMHHGEGPRRFLPSGAVKDLLRQAGFRLVLHRGTVLIPFGPGWLRRWGLRWLDERAAGTPFAELGIRQFYVATVAG